MADLPLIMTEAGPVPTPPATIQQQLLATVESTSPGYTARLPGLLIEDFSSTAVASLAVADAARVETINSLTPFGANAFLLNQQGQMTGVSQASETNTTVQQVFTGTPNFVINAGFLVSDGSNQYYALDGGIVGSTGSSLPLTFAAVNPGSWAVPAGTVTTIETSVPSTITLSCTNPYAGTPGNSAQTQSSYRAQVLQAWATPGQGMPSYIKTMVGAVAGVQQRLISVQQQANGFLKVIVGGTYDPTQVAYAIYQGVSNPSALAGSTMSITGISNATNAVITTALNHGYAAGQQVTANYVQGMTPINGVNLTVGTVLSETSFSTNFNSTSSAAYTTGGVMTPNLRNNLVSVQDYPDVYNIVFVSPPQQVVTATVTWNTTATNFINVGAIAQYAAPALAAYVNQIYAGQPMSLFDLQDAFRNAVSTVIAPALVTRLVFAISINGVGAAPSTGTGVIAGDPESYLWTDPSGVGFTIAQG